MNLGRIIDSDCVTFQRVNGVQKCQMSDLMAHSG